MDPYIAQERPPAWPIFSKRSIKAPCVTTSREHALTRLAEQGIEHIDSRTNLLKGGWDDTSVTTAQGLGQATAQAKRPRVRVQLHGDTSMDIAKERPPAWPDDASIKASTYAPHGLAGQAMSISA